VVDLNHIFLFIAVISPLLVLARAWRPGGTHRGWRVAALIVLAITAASWLVLRERAGYIGGGAWFVILFVPAIGLRKVTELAAQHCYRSARRLAVALQIFHPTAELREQIAYFRLLESQDAFPSFERGTPPQDRPDSRPEGSRLAQSAGSPSSFHTVPYDNDTVSVEGAARLSGVRRHRRLWNAPAVLVFILLNVAAFLFEISFGDWTDPVTLHRLGALEPYAVVVQGEYWRLFTALFLHAGSAHLFFNLFALYVLGPPLERSIGALRFAACYLIAGFGSSADVALLTVFGLVHPAQLVGASGCVMGIVGAWAGFLLRHHHAPRARQRLANIAMIVLIQIAFDLSTPQVSMAAHLCGLITGFLAGLAIAPKKMSIYARSGRFTEPPG
jgi:membrane associated rhomboid family serine protease